MAHHPKHLLKKVTKHHPVVDRSFFKRPQALVVMLIFGFIGAFLLFETFAASPYFSVQPEAGSKTGNANFCSNDTTASTDGYVQFNGTCSSTIAYYEAEAAAHDATSQVASGPDKAYARGGAVLGFFGNQGQFVTFTVNVASAGAYPVTLYYAAADGTTAKLNPLPRTLVVNGVSAGTLNFPRTNAGNDVWNSITPMSLGTLNLNAGNNTIRLQIDTNQEAYWDVDYLTVQGGGGSQPPPPPTCPPGTTGTPPNCVTDPNPPPPSQNPVPETIVSNAIYVATNGNDSSSGTLAQPLRSVQTALDRTSGGGTIYIREGSHEVCGANNNAGTEQSYVRVVNYPNNTSQAKLVCTAPNQGGLFYTHGRQGNYFEVKNLYLDCANLATPIWSNGSIFEPNNGSHHIKIIGNYITGCGQSGIGLFNTDNVLIEANTITGNAHDGFFSGISTFEMVNKPGNPIDSRGYRIVIKNNRVYKNLRTVGAVTDGNCIIFDHNNTFDFTGRALVENNVCFNNYGPGLRIVDSSNIDAFNNTFYQDVESITETANPWSPIPNAPYAEIDLDHHSNDFPLSDRPSNVLIKNNIIVPRAGRAPFCLILMQPNEMVELNDRFENNLITGQFNTSNDCPAITGNGNIINVDPKFVAPGYEANADFRLQAGSPAINAGGSGGPSNDFTYQSRNGVPDIGAYEFR